MVNVEPSTVTYVWKRNGMRLRVSNREFINFREILKQLLRSENFQLKLSSSSGTAVIMNRSFEFRFLNKEHKELLQIDFRNCHPNPAYLLLSTGAGWTMEDGDPVDDMSSEELAHHCVALLNAMESD